VHEAARIGEQRALVPRQQRSHGAQVDEARRLAERASAVGWIEILRLIDGLWPAALPPRRSFFSPPLAEVGTGFVVERPLCYRYR
jgi:hypothetical protein